MWIAIGNFLSVCLCALITLSPLNVRAEDVSFDATVNANKISLQDSIELTLTVRGAKADVPIIKLPLIDGFDARYVGPSTRFMIVNGVSSSEHSFTYNLFPSKVGHYQIPAISLTLDNQTYNTSPIDIEVVDKPVESSNSDNSNSGGGSINDKVFMQAAIASKEFYEGEKTPLQMKVFVKDLSLQLASAPTLNPEGFTADATATMQKTKELINGVDYDLLKFDTNIYPTRGGTLKIGPFSVQGELVYRTRPSNDIFGDFFGNTQTRPITLNAPEITINVLPLPSEGKPVDFSGAVGQYDFKASIGPSTVKLGDPITLHMLVSGQGRLKGITLPVFNDSRFKTYDPQIKQDEGTASVEQIIIPTNQNVTEVPALSFTYFDPQSKKYETITQGPFPIKILAPAVGEEFKAYGFIDKTKSNSDKSVVVRLGVRKLAQDVLEKIISLLKNLLFWICILIAGALWVAFHLWKQFQDRLSKDEVFAREWKADSKAKELLKNTKTCLENSNSKEFYKSVYKTLNDYLADKMHVPLASLNTTVIDEYLTKRKADPAKIKIIKELLERCDLVRFASASISSQEMVGDFQKLQDLIHYLSKVLK